MNTARFHHLGTLYQPGSAAECRWEPYRGYTMDGEKLKNPKHGPYCHARVQACTFSLSRRSGNDVSLTTRVNKRR